MKRLILAFLLLTLPAQAQDPRTMALWKGVTNGNLFGVPRYTTALLPPCNTSNLGATAYDTTTTEVKICNGTTWSSTPFGGGITIGTTTITGGADGNLLYNNGGVAGGFGTYDDSGAGNATTVFRKTPGAGQAAAEFSNGTVARASLIAFDNTTPVFTIKDGGSAETANADCTTAGINWGASGDTDYGLCWLSGISAVAAIRNGVVAAAFDSAPGVLVRSDGIFEWASNTTPSGNYDTSLSRVAAGVVRANGASAAAGWVQQAAGELALNADYTNATASMTNTALSATLKSGRTYSFTLAIMFADSVAADGATFDFDGGTVTVTNFRAHCSAVNATGASLAFGAANTTALATDLAVTLALTTQATMTCQGTIVPSANGTLIFRAQQTAHSTGTLTIFRGSWLNIRDANPL